MAHKKSAIVMNDKDNTATVVEMIGPGTEVSLDVGGKKLSVVVSQKVPFGHKFAIRTIVKGAAIIKYGETIGYATRDIATGEHVHVHNLESGRGRGDR